VLCWAQGKVLLERYKARLESGRHPGHAEVGGLDIAQADLARGRAEPLAITATFEVDTTDFDAINYPALFRSLEPVDG
jgi:hypothetical protein